jgi:hypothetical protein
MLRGIWGDEWGLNGGNRLKEIKERIKKENLC